MVAVGHLCATLSLLAGFLAYLPTHRIAYNVPVFPCLGLSWFISFAEISVASLVEHPPVWSAGFGVAVGSSHLCAGVVVSDMVGV